MITTDPGIHEYEITNKEYFEVKIDRWDTTERRLKNAEIIIKRNLRSNTYDILMHDQSDLTLNLYINHVGPIYDRRIDTLLSKSGINDFLTYSKYKLLIRDTKQSFAKFKSLVILADGVKLEILHKSSNINKFVAGNTGSFFNYKILKAVKFKIKNSYVNSSDRQYYNFAVKPKKIIEGKFNSSVAEIYLSKEIAHKIMNADLRMQLNYLKTTSFPKGIRAHIEPSNDSNIEHGLMHYADIIVDDFTYYDYLKKKSYIGFKKGSNKGIFIPLSFKGQWHEEINIEFNDYLDDVQINSQQQIDKPILDPYEGVVKLNVLHQPFKNLIPQFSIDAHEIKGLDKKVSLEFWERNNDFTQEKNY